jgi:hypothetical protein
MQQMEVNDQFDVPGKETSVLLPLEVGCALESNEILWKKKKLLSQPGFNPPPLIVHPAT